MIRPDTDGANAVEPGISLRSVHFLTVPGGQMHLPLLRMPLDHGADVEVRPQEVAVHVPAGPVVHGLVEVGP